jgi:hypothetical protein
MQSSKQLEGIELRCPSDVNDVREEHPWNKPPIETPLTLSRSRSTFEFLSLICGLSVLNIAVSSDVQFLKTASPIAVTVDGTTICFKPLPQKTLEHIVSRPSFRVALSSLVQSLKALMPNNVRADGIVTDCKPELSNDHRPNVVMLSLNVTLAKLVHL